MEVCLTANSPAGTPTGQMLPLRRGMGQVGGQSHYALALDQHFEVSLAGDGLAASPILMGCNAFTYQGTPFKILKVYRRLAAPKSGEPKVVQQIRDIVRDTADFIHHDLADKPDDQPG